MKACTRGAAALCLGVGSALCAWALSAHGVLAATVTALGLVAGGLVVALVRERRASGELERALGGETERARQVSDHAWQSTLLTQLVDELRTSLDEDVVLQTATTALVRTLKASRAVVFRREDAETWRVRAQFVSEGVAPLKADAVLPPVLASDRELAERLSASEPTSEADPELRALAERLQVHSIVVAAVGDDHILTVEQCEEPRSWTSTERRFIQRFADQLASAITRGAEYQKQNQDAEARSGLLRVAHALSGARESRAVLEIATSVGAPLAQSRASAILVDRDGYGFRVAAEHGFAPELSPACVHSLESALEDSLRARSTIRVSPAVAGRRAEMKSFGPLLIVPLYYGREAMGVFLFEKASSERSWSETDADIAGALGELTASALKNASLFETLTSAEIRYADLYDNASDLYQTLDARGRILECNLTQCLKLGYKKEDLIGRRFESVLAHASVARWRSLEIELFDKGHVHDANFKLLTREGRNVEVVVNASVVLASEGRPLSARVVMRDVSEQRRLEHQLRQSQKLEVVGALAGGIAHDFNNVLGGILGYASLLHAHLRDRPHARRYVDTIERSAVRGAELTGRLLAASRKTEAKQEAVNLNEVVEETLELLAHTFHKKIRIGKRLDSRVRPLLADAGQLQQIVLNLCVNARDAMPDGGLLRVETEVDERENRLRLSVEDAGVGMEPTTMQRLFEPFFSTKGESGTGLGLSVVYGIVKSLGGDVRVKSSPGKGARFDIFLPTKWVEARERPKELAPPMSGRGELVLLVDDERVLRELGKEILETHGYRVQAVGSGEDALSFIRSSDEAVALVILDLVMPGLDGGETYRRLRDVDTNVPILLSSGLSSEEAVEGILADGATGFLAKPYGIGELTQAVRAAIRRDAPMMH